jgi:hypothetical protein
MTTIEQRINDIEEVGVRARGKVELLKHFAKERLSAMEAIRAKCYDCCGYYADGIEDCGIVSCPLYRYMPYNMQREKKTRVMTKEQKIIVADRFKKAKKAKR